jgi:hypothetical protein
LKTNPEIRLVPVKDELARLQNSGALVWKNLDDLISCDFLRTFPGVHPCDGFFAAVLEKPLNHSARQAANQETPLKRRGTEETEEIENRVIG